MSESIISVVRDRIEAATQESPIAVFSSDKDKMYDAVFANTIVTDGIITEGDSRLMGVFWGSDGLRAFDGMTHIPATKDIGAGSE